MESDSDTYHIMMQILVLIVLTLINAFFAGAEMAVVSVNRNKIRKLTKEGNSRANLIEVLLEDSTSFLSTIQVAITLAGFFSSASAATGISKVLAGWMEKKGVAYSQSVAIIVVTIILSYFTLVFGELVPKRIALQKAEWFSLVAVKPIYYISKIMAPFIKLLSVSTNGFLKLIGMKTESLEEEVSEEEIKAILETGSQVGVFNQIEKEMITSIFSFDDKKAKEVMIPRQEILAIDINEPVEDYLEQLLTSKYSRIPVYDGNIDNIIGILPMKEYMLQVSKSKRKHIDIRDMMQSPYFVLENKRIDKLFKDMQSRKIRMAIIIDEYGGISGLLTIENLIEEIVGDMYEEGEIEEDAIKSVGDNHYQIQGNTMIYQINEELQLNIISQCDTISGYLIDTIGHIPDRAELPLDIVKDGYKFTVQEVEKHKIKILILGT